MLSSYEMMNKVLFGCSKLAIIPGDSLLNHTLVAPFRVVGNALHMTLLGVIYRCTKVLKDSIWSRGSFHPSKDSSCGSRNMGGNGQFGTSVVKGESVLRIIPSRLDVDLSFIAFFSLSISLSILRNISSILKEFSPSGILLQ